MDRHAIHDDLAFLNRFQTADAPDQGGFSRSAGAEDHQDSSFGDFQIDAIEPMEIAKPFVDLLEFNHIVSLKSLYCHTAFKIVGQQGQPVGNYKIPCTHQENTIRHSRIILKLKSASISASLCKGMPGKFADMPCF